MPGPKPGALPLGEPPMDDKILEVILREKVVYFKRNDVYDPDSAILKHISRKPR